MTRYQLALLVGIAVATAASWIRAPYPQDMILQHIPTVVALIAWPFLARRYPVSDTAATCLAAFLLLHVLGARYLYSNVPYDGWTKALLGLDLTARFGLRRNHFDRLVHFAFGVLFVRPVWEIEVRHLHLPRRAAWFTALEFVLAVSMLYELFEWAISVVLAPDAADAYNGQQGDLWDAQKDMAFALAGAVLALALLALTRRGRVSRAPHRLTPLQ
jgi:putative membrane protein